MLAHLGTRTLAGAVVVAGVVTLTFLLVRLAPGDPVERLLGPTATPAQLEVQRRALGLDRPLAAQYAIWLGRFARGDWGKSIATGRPVRALLGDAVPATLALVGTSLVLSYLLGLAVGAWQSSAGPRVDTALSIATVTLFAVPGYWLGRTGCPRSARPGSMPTRSRAGAAWPTGCATSRCRSPPSR